MTTLRLSIAGLVLAAGCAAPPAEPRLDLVAVERELMEADRDFARETAARGVDGWVEAFAEDGKMMSGGPIIEGHAAIREAMGALSRPGYSLEWEPLAAEASASGDLGFTHGTYRREVQREEGEPLVETGRYVTIWRRDPSGAFKVVLDIGNPSPERTQ